MLEHRLCRPIIISARRAEREVNEVVSEVLRLFACQYGCIEALEKPLTFLVPVPGIRTSDVAIASWPEWLRFLLRHSSLLPTAQAATASCCREKDANMHVVPSNVSWPVPINNAMLSAGLVQGAQHSDYKDLALD